MTIRNLYTSLVVMILSVMTAGVASAKGESGTLPYLDHGAMVEAATAKLRKCLHDNPSYSADSLRARFLDTLCEGNHVGRASALTPARRKKLTAAQVFEAARHSSLIFGKMEHNDKFNADSAYKTASAVALTPDGICATNYHVVADLVLDGSFSLKDKNDMCRFVMDYDGNVYPVTEILAIDPTNDWAIFRVDTLGDSLTPAPVGDDLPMGTPVYCLSSTTGSHFHYTDGMVANRTQQTDKRTGHTQYILEITADYGVGASGGPIFDDCGNLVALVSSTLSIYAQPEQYRNFQMTYKQTVPVFLIKECFN